MHTEPTISGPPRRARTIGEAALTGTRAERFVPQRGLVRRIRNARASDGLQSLAERHRLDRETRELLSAELIKAGAPPITQDAAERALGRFVHFEPLNADALRPFLILGTQREHRALAVAGIADAMRKAGRGIRLFSDALDAADNTHLTRAGERHGCGVKVFDGASECVEMLRRVDLASLSLIEAGLRAPLDQIALKRLQKLCRATGAEPIAVVTMTDALQALGFARIGVRRMILVETGGSVVLGPALDAARRGSLCFSEFLAAHKPGAPLRPARATELAEMLVGG